MVHAVWPKNTIVALVLKGQTFGQSIVNVHHFEASAVREALLLNDGVAQSQADSLAADWVTNCLAAWLACHTPEYTLLNVQSQVLERPGMFEHKLGAIDRFQPAGTAGTRGGAVGAGSLVDAAILRWRSTSAGKHHRGRTYVGPLATVDLASGQLAISITALVTAYGTAMRTRYFASGIGSNLDFNMTVYSRPFNNGKEYYKKKVAGVPTLFFPPDYDGNSSGVTSFAVDPVGRSQRRREVGVGS